MKITVFLCLMIEGVAMVNAQLNWTEPIPITSGSANFVHPMFGNAHSPVSFEEEVLVFSRGGKDIGILQTTGNGAAWSDSVMYITDDSADNDFPSMNRIMLVWQSRRNGNLDIYFSIFGPYSWSTPQPVALTSEDDRYPHIVEAPYPPRYFAVWEQRGRILFSEFNGTVWLAPQYITPPGDTLNHFPQVGIVYTSPPSQPLVIWERKKEGDTTNAVMYANRNGTAWTTPDTLVYTGDNRRPRFFKYIYYDPIYWEKRSGNSSLCHAGNVTMIGNKLVIVNSSPVTHPDNQHNASVRKGLYITTRPNSPNLFGYDIATWESWSGGIDSIGVFGQGPAPNCKLSPSGAISNRNPDVSAGTWVGASLLRIWVVWQANIAGSWQLCGSNKLMIINDVVEGNGLEYSFRLDQNYPNPFNPTTSIEFQIPSANYVTLKVFDMLGREVATLVNERKEAGSHSVSLDAGRLSSGMYFYRLAAGSLVDVKKLLLIK